MIAPVLAPFLRIGKAATAVGAVKQSCKHLDFTRFGRTVLGTQYLVNRIPKLLCNDRLMAVLDDYPVLFGCPNLLLAFDGFAPPLAVYKLS